MCFSKTSFGSLYSLNKCYFYVGKKYAQESIVVWANISILHNTIARKNDVQCAVKRAKLRYFEANTPLFHRAIHKIINDQKIFHFSYECRNSLWIQTLARSL